MNTSNIPTPANLPVELISFRGLLKSFEDIKRSNSFFLIVKGRLFFLSDYHNSLIGNFSKKNETDEKTGSSKSKAINAIKDTINFVIFCLIGIVESFLYFMVGLFFFY
jgi:hypothetical protein